MNEKSASPLPAYRIETARLIIRCWAPKDGPARRALLDASDQHLRPDIPYMRDEPMPLAGTVAWLRKTRAAFDSDSDYRYAVYGRDGTTLIGETGLYKRAGPDALEIGYLVGVDHVGRGYATEAASAMVRTAFEVHRVERLEIRCSPDNRPSAKIPEKLGFTLEAVLKRRSTDSDGNASDDMIWTLFRDDYPQSPAAAQRLEAYGCLGERLL